MTAENNMLLGQARERLQAIYGRRLQAVVLYGSMARGNASADSDMDLLVVLRDRVIPRDDLRKAIHALYPLTLQSGHPCSPHLVDAATYNAGQYPLYRAIQAEGVMA